MKKINKNEKLVSVVIVSRDRKADLIECIDSYLNQTYKNIELITVDNASVPPLVSWLPKKYPKVKLVASVENVGAAEGRNLGIKAASGEYIVFSDDDAYAKRDMVKNLIKVFEQKKKTGAVQPITFDKTDKELITGAGHNINLTTGRVSAWGVREPNFGQYDGIREVPMVGCVWMIKKSTIGKVGVFDQDYFIPYEDSDLCVRLINAGFKNYCTSEAITYHQGPKKTYVHPRIEWLGITSAERAYRLARNKIIFMRKHSPFPSNIFFFLIMLPVYAVLHSIIIISAGKWDILMRYWLGLLSGLAYAIYKPLLGLRKNYWEIDKDLHGFKMRLLAWTDPIPIVFDKKAKTVLDLACGQGKPMELIKMRTKIKYSEGVDLFEPYIKEAKENKTHDKYVLKDIRKISYKNNAFDVVLASHVLEHMSKKDAWKLLEKMEKIAKKQVIIATPIGEMYHHAEHGNELQLHMCHFYPEEFEKRGYKILKYGRKSLLGEGGLVHIYRNDILRKVLYTINILLTPIYYCVQDFSDYVFVAYKDVSKAK